MGESRKYGEQERIEVICRCSKACKSYVKKRLICILTLGPALTSAVSAQTEDTDQEDQDDNDDDDDSASGDRDIFIKELVNFYLILL